MNQNETKSALSESTIPLVFQLRELVLPGSDREVYLNRTQSSCGGEDSIEPE